MAVVRSLPRGSSARGALFASLALLALLLFALAPSAGAQGLAGSASAEAFPAHLAPGEQVQLTFRVDPPDLLEIVLQENVVCTLTDPASVTTEPCARAGSLVTARVLDSGVHEFVFTLDAPELEGVYTVQFEARSTLTLLPSTYAADTTFTVAAPTPPAGGPADPTPTVSTPTPAAPSTPTPEPGGDPDEEPITPATEPDGERPGDPAGADTMRWFVSNAMGLAAGTLAILASLWRIGGGLP